jgi:hypothetical protein
MTAYGVDEKTYWTPPSCVKCGGEMTAAEKIADLGHSPRHRYQIQLRSPTSEQAAEWPYRQEVCADRFETTNSAVVFYTGSQVVASYRQMTAPPQRIG